MEAKREQPLNGGLEPAVAVDRAERQTRSKAMAMPWPPPMHMVQSARLPPVRSSSYSALTIRIAPVAPTGWPSAMAPPFGFTLAGSRPSPLVTASACAAKASFDSITSKSSTVRPVRASSFSTAGTGPIPITSGRTPAWA